MRAALRDVGQASQSACGESVASPDPGKTGASFVFIATAVPSNGSKAMGPARLLMAAPPHPSRTRPDRMGQSRVAVTAGETALLHSSSCAQPKGGRDEDGCRRDSRMPDSACVQVGQHATTGPVSRSYVDERRHNRSRRGARTDQSEHRREGSARQETCVFEERLMRATQLEDLKPFGLAVWKLPSGRVVAGRFPREDSICRIRPTGRSTPRCGNAECERIRWALGKIARGWRNR